ncbi:hypothetical protein [Pectobacterium carotovorum]|uniref:hypothetical protein n=1 Tax=Pectobacterium carotovorum TaxID=554 RepID=UPI003816B6F0
MKIDDALLSLIGTCVTILCAVGSLVGWWRSRSAATDAEFAVQQIQNHRNIRRTGTIDTTLGNALKSVRRIGLGCNVEKIVGINIDPIIDKMEIFLEQLQEFFTDPQLRNQLNLDLDEFLSEIRENILSLSDSNLPEEKSSAGRTIYLKLTSLKATIGIISDGITFNTNGAKK